MKHLLLVVVLCSGLSGCTTHTAPSHVLFGAHFPAWMLAAALGLVTALAVHIATVATGLANPKRLQLLSCTGYGATTAVVWWLMWFAI